MKINVKVKKKMSSTKRNGGQLEREKVFNQGKIKK